MAEIPVEQLRYLDEALLGLEPDKMYEYEEAIELWITYGGD